MSEIRGQGRIFEVITGTEQGIRGVDDYRIDLEGRKPRLFADLPGPNPSRNAALQRFSLTFQEPPRSALSDVGAGPVGSTVSPL